MIETHRHPGPDGMDSRGFTFIEVLLALAIFAIGILAMYAMQISAVNSNAAARKRTEAVSWATNEMETLKSSPFASLANGQVARGIYTVSWAITDIDLDKDGATDAKGISVGVVYPGGRGPQSTRLDYVRVSD